MEKRNSTVLIEPMFLPPISFFKMLKKQERLQIEMYEFYRKSTYRNRCYIPTANGIQLLTVPVQHSKEKKQAMLNVKIHHQSNWQREMWRTIYCCYKKSPYYEFYESDFQKIIFTKFETLAELNIELLKLILKILNFSIEISFSEKYEAEVLCVNDKRNFLLPINFSSNTDKETFEYHQVFEDRLGFIADVSMLDLIFCEGGNAVQFF